MKIMKTESFNPSKRAMQVNFSSREEQKKPSKFEQEKRRVYIAIGVLTSGCIAAWFLISFAKKIIIKNSAEIKSFFSKIFNKN